MGAINAVTPQSRMSLYDSRLTLESPRVEQTERLRLDCGDRIKPPLIQFTEALMFNPS